MKRIVALMLVLMLALSLCACGGEPDPREGMYTAVSVENSGFTFDVEDEWAEIKGGGRMTVRMQGQEYSGKYTLDDENNLVFDQGGSKFYGVIMDEKLYIDFDGLFYCYVKQN